VNTETTTTETTDQGQVTEGAENQQSAQIADLDSYEKFKFQGREFTPEELNERLTGYEKLQNQSKEFAEEGKYATNLRADLELVRSKPDLADHFKRIYPQKYHAWLDFALKQDRQDEAKGKEQTSTLPKDVEAKLQSLEEKIGRYESKEREAEIKAIDAELDSKFSKLSEKYPHAVEADVLAKAEAMIAKGLKVTDGTWDRLWKASNEHFEKKWSGLHEAKVKAQIEKGIVSNCLVCSLIK